MADDDQVNEAKSDIDAVRDIVGAGPSSAPASPASPPSPPPNVTPPPITLNSTSDIDEQIAVATAKRNAAKDLGESNYYQSQISQLEEQKAQRQELSKQGCSPAAIAILVFLGLVASLAALGVKSKLDDNNSSKTSTAAGAASGASSSCDQSGARADRMVFIDCAAPAPLDGHWVLVDGLNNPGFDMGVACDTGCQTTRQVTVDKSDVSMDISGDKITGGTYKTGYSSTMGGSCTEFNSHVDATVSGGADQVNKYGQLIVDGNQTNDDSCDANLQQITKKSTFHTSRFYFLSAPDTLTICYNLNAAFNGCTAVGFSTPPPNGGIAATFKRG